MRKFIIKSLILSVLIILSLFTIIKVVSPIIRNTNDYVAESIDKEKRLSTIIKPKIIFVGGSNLAFGLDSKMIQTTTNYPVVNMALHAGLGLDFMLNEVSAGIKKNDIVILSIEYNLNDRPDLKLLAQLLDLNPEAKKYAQLTYNETAKYYAFDVQRCLTSSIKLWGKKFSNNIYLRNGFSSEGDLLTYLNMENVPFLINKFSISNYTERINKINNLVKVCQTKGAKIYYVFPTCQKSTFLLNNSFVKNYSTIILKTLKCPTLGSPETFVYDDKYYFNSEYHLNKEGRKLRTIDILKLFVNQNILDGN